MTDLYITTILSTMFGSASVSGPFYFGLIDSASYTGFDEASDTMSSHAGWTEFTSYSESTRVLWVPGTAADESISNPDEASFTPSADGTVVGYFITTGSAKGGTAGSLIEIVLFDEPQGVYNGEIFRVKHTFQGKDMGA